jgi:hypothetical protein
MEGVNRDAVNKFAQQTNAEYKVDGRDQTGTQLMTDCAFDSPSGSSGCEVNDVRAGSFGFGFNVAGGGYYVMEWDSVPLSLIARKPDTSEFGIPAANFEGDCDIDKHDRSLQQLFYSGP